MDHLNRTLPLHPLCCTDTQLQTLCAFGQLLPQTCLLLPNTCHADSNAAWLSAVTTYECGLFTAHADSLRAFACCSWRCACAAEPALMSCICMTHSRACEKSKNQRRLRTLHAVSESLYTGKGCRLVEGEALATSHKQAY